jgi:phosphopantothenoylcysteine decarboxylase / phosphopantothenate---cysteine ligase
MKILLMVSGSISAYKSFDIARSLVKKNHQVKVVLTKGALKFVRPEVFLYLGCEEVFDSIDDFKPKKKGVLHVDLVQWADAGLLAPLSAGCLSRLAKNKASDLISSIFLAWQKTKPFLVSPAMNTEMWTHPFTQEHIKKISTLPWVGVIAPAEGLLACGDVGPGKLPDPQFISELITCYNPLKKNKKVVTITTGATVAPIDSVRYVTNPSTGKTGYEVAKKFLLEGYEVHLILGHQTHPMIEALRFHPNSHLYLTPSTNEMKEVALKLFVKSDLYISAAAVADIEFEVVNQKVKKKDLKDLKIKGAVDILAEVLKLKKPNQTVISFGAETDVSEPVFREKMERKPVDLMVGNLVHNGLSSKADLQGFAQDSGTYYFVLPNKTLSPQSLSKDQLAQKLLQFSQMGSL